MDKPTFVEYYKHILKDTLSDQRYGLEIVSAYIMDEGNDYQKTHVKDFLNLMYIPPLYAHCLQRAIDYYVDKFSVVVVTAKPDPYVSSMNSEKVVTIY